MSTNAIDATIHVVDDDESFRTALQRLLRAAGYETRTYASAREFLMAERGSGPECLVLDVQMPGLNGLDLQKALSESGDSPPIIFLSGEGSIPATVQAMKAGAANFLTKPVKRFVLLTVIAEALAANAEAQAGREDLRKLRDHYKRLTPREQQVFEGVVAGKLNKVIAAELGTVERTIKAHRANVMQKMDAGSLAELVHLANKLRSHTPPTGAGPQGNASASCPA